MAVLLNRAAVPTSFKKLMGTPCQQSGQQRLSYLKSQKHRVESGAEDVGGAGWQQRGEPLRGEEHEGCVLARNVADYADNLLVSAEKPY